MSHQSYELKAERREKVGKGAARELRRNGLVPAVIYGDKKDPLPIALSRKEVTLRLHGGGFMTTLATIEVDGEKHQVLPKDYQADPVRDFITHVDFLRIGKGSRVVVEIPVHFLNEEDCPGLKRGGVLNVVRHRVAVHCPVDAIPEEIVADLTGMDINDSLHISAIPLPEGCKLSVTGLMDWAAQAKLEDLDNLHDAVDEIVFQTYRGARTVADIDAYVKRLARLRIPFRLGLAEGATWSPPPGLAGNPNFRGYVVFLRNARVRR